MPLLNKSVKNNKPFWIRYINKRIEKNKNFLAIISGATGSGKSWSALSIAEMLNDNFTIDRVIFRGSELMQLINNPDCLPEKKGVVFIWDEAGIDISSRNWQSLGNKMINFLIQTFRHQNFILLFTSPYTDFIDSATRKLFHAELNTININERNRTVKLKPKLLQYNADMHKFYKKYLRVKTDNGIVPINEWVIKAPSEQLINDYECKKKRFTTELNRSIENELNRIAPKKLRELSENQIKIKECWDKGIIKQIDISKITGIDTGEVSRNVTRMIRKGYRIPISKIESV